MAAISPANSLDPPQPLLVRTAQVGTAIVNTIRVPGDPFANESSKWFESGKEPFLTDGNEVKYMIDARKTFREMVAALRTATGAGHFIYMLNWWLDLDFELSSESVDHLEPGPLNLQNILDKASNAGVMVRAVAWDQQFSRQNDDSILRINGMKNGAAILDATGNEPIPVPIIGILPMHFGSQHQKILCILGEQGLICFCGGIDFNPDRILDTQKSGNPLHDVHCRIRGPAALDLLKVFEQRWNEHPSRKILEQKKGPLLPAGTPPKSGNHFVRVGRTFGRRLYSFAPNGETTARDVILHAIRDASRFIYTEDQYFVGNPELADALVAALSNGIRHLTILLTHWRISDLPLVQRHRMAFIQRLKSAGQDRVRVFARNPTTGPQDPRKATDPLFQSFDDGKLPHTYVHAKLWIVDDEFAAMGSVNSNRRSYSHDSEVVAGIYDTSLDTVLTYRLAHQLRIQLWQEHLAMGGPNGAAELWNGVASAVHWLPGNRPPGAQVHEYDENEPTLGRDNIPAPLIGPLINSEAVFNSIIDPA